MKDAPEVTYLFDEAKDHNLECGGDYAGMRHGITYGGNYEVEGPVCETTVQVHGTDEMKCRLPIVLRQENQNAYRGGILGMSPYDDAAGPLFV